MGQKVIPIGIRLKIVNSWDSLWCDDRCYASKLHEDLKLRNIIKKKFFHAAISKIVIARKVDLVVITVYTAKPGVIIGKKGSDIERVKQDLKKSIEGSLELNIVELKKPEMSAVLIAESIAHQLEKRVPFRRAMKKSIQACLRVGAKGIKISCSGRLAGAEIARTEQYKEGRIPLHTLRANIDYGVHQAKTTYGIIGVKVWVYHGDLSSYNND